jgi:hypothetical protein
VIDSVGKFFHSKVDTSVSVSFILTLDFFLIDNKQMSFEINPCQSVAKSVSTANCDINTINNDCYGICASYGNVYGPKVQEKCETQCRDMISRKKKDMGKNDCDLRRPSPPPGWNQIPDFYARLLASCGNQKKAYVQCCTMCNSSRYPNECKEKCQLDANAVVTSEHYEDKKHHNNNKKKYYYDKSMKAHPVLFFAGFAIVVVSICILLYFSLRALYKD